MDRWNFNVKKSKYFDKEKRNTRNFTTFYFTNNNGNISR